uniref:DUF2013 domain-containing protein n=1 Tax=Gongylonema pulchrum TaxID=637853 RepID=A0A183DD15_9BILA
LIALIDRLAIYASCEGAEIPADLPLFDIFSKQTESVIMSRDGMPPEDIVSLQIMKFLRIPVDQYDDVVQLLHLEHYSDVIELLDYRGRTQAASYVLQNMIENDTALTTMEEVEKLLHLIESLLVDQEDQPNDLENSEDFVDEQILVARLVNLIHAPSTD